MGLTEVVQAYWMPGCSSCLRMKEFISKSGREWVAIMPLLILMFWMGIFSQTFMPAISTQNARILDQTQTRQVKIEPAQAPATEVSSAR